MRSRRRSAIAAVSALLSRLDEDSGAASCGSSRRLAVIGDRRAQLGGSDSTIADRIRCSRR
jgi:hypothetical protein